MSRLGTAGRTVGITMGIAVLAIASAALASERQVEGRVVLGAGQELRLDFPVGDLEIEGVAGDEFTIEVSGRCKRHSQRCDEQLEEIRIDIREGRNGLWVEVSPHSKWGWWDKLELEARARHPADRPLSVDMGVGRLKVSGTESDLELDLGVGEVSVDLEVDYVRTVEVEAGIGDTELLVPDGWIDGERSFLIGSESHWRDGPGEARIDVEVGVGEAAVRLDD